MKGRGNEDYLKTLPTMGWDGIAEAMADECWPASHKERKAFLEQDWDEIPSRVQIDKIDDGDIRASTYFLGEVVEQCQRIKAHAKFNEVLGSPQRTYSQTNYIESGQCTVFSPNLPKSNWHLETMK